MDSIVPIALEGNPLYPLPSDYNDLTEDGQRLARVNASRQWLLDEDAPSTNGDRLVASTMFFDWYYLQPDEAGDRGAPEFDPQFYEMPPIPSPSFHWDISRIWAGVDMSLIIAPRGGAKTTHSEKDTLLRLVSTKYSIVHATSTFDNAKHIGNRLRDQLFENPRIIEDFGVLKPVRGQKSMGVDYLRLNNGSWLRCVSAASKLRGARVRLFRLDDPEHDAKASTSMEDLRANMERFLFSVVLPMTSRQKCAVHWLATFVSPRHFAYYAMQMVDTPEGRRAIDPRFDAWHRFHIRGATRSPSGDLVSCWPHMWPSSRAQATELGVPKAKTLQDLELRMGAAAYRREMLGEMTASEDSYFKLDISPRGRHAWWFEDIDDLLRDNPRGSHALVCWIDTVKGAEVLTRVPLHEWLNQVRLFMTVDTAFTEKATSDRRCVTLMAVDHRNNLFVLDMWSDKKGDDVLLKRSFALADRWRCPVIFVEVVKESLKLYVRFDSAVRTRIAEAMDVDWNPAIRPLRPGTMEKTAKIATLDLRFEHGLIKYPLFARHTNPSVDRLVNQTQGFDPDATSDGGLANDDELDTVSMSTQALRGRLRESAPRAVPAGKGDVLAALKAGAREVGGVPLTGIPLDLIPADVLRELVSAYHGDRQESQL